MKMRSMLTGLLALCLMLPATLSAGLKDKLPDWKMPRLKLPSLAYQPSSSFALDGWIDHSTMWMSDSSEAGYYNDNLMLHTGRVILGAHGKLGVPFSLGKLSYNLKTGATLAQNSLYEQRIWTPEIDGRVTWQLNHALQVGGFARYGWRQPNTFMVDSLRRRDLIAGLSINAHPFRHTSLSLTAGNRLVMNEDEESDHSFMRAEIEQRLPFLDQFVIRAWGESAWYGLADSLDFDLQRNLGGLAMGGRLPGGAHLSSHNTYLYREGVKRVVGENRLRYQLGERQRISANAGADYTEVEEQKIYHQHANISYRWMYLEPLGLELRADNERAEKDEVDWIHRRTVLLSTVWDWKPLARVGQEDRSSSEQPIWKRWFLHSLHLKRQLSLSGFVGGGFMQSLRYGKGWLGKGEFELLQPVDLNSWLSITFRERVSAELFHMRDVDLFPADTKQNQVEADNLLGLGTTLFPEKAWRMGHRIDWRRHVGTHLMFSEDTLRNTLANEVWTGWRGGRLRAELSAMFVSHLVEEDPIELETRYAARLRWQPTRVMAFNLQGVWRPEQDDFDERIWLRSYAEVEMNKLRLSADLRFTGMAEDFGDRDTQAWVHVVRELW